ncbi:hypothetical protein D3C75_867690 [compost metagenome]
MPDHGIKAVSQILELTFIAAIGTYGQISGCQRFEQRGQLYNRLGNSAGQQHTETNGDKQGGNRYNEDFHQHILNRTFNIGVGIDNGNGKIGLWNFVDSQIFALQFDGLRI